MRIHRILHPSVGTLSRLNQSTTMAIMFANFTIHITNTKTFLNANIYHAGLVLHGHLRNTSPINRRAAITNRFWKSSSLIVFSTGPLLYPRSTAYLMTLLKNYLLINTLLLLLPVIKYLSAAWFFLPIFRSEAFLKI